MDWLRPKVRTPAWCGTVPVVTSCPPPCGHSYLLQGSCQLLTKDYVQLLMGWLYSMCMSKLAVQDTVSSFFKELSGGFNFQSLTKITEAIVVLCFVFLRLSSNWSRKMNKTNFLEMRTPPRREPRSCGHISTRRTMVKYLPFPLSSMGALYRAWAVRCQRPRNMAFL